MHTYFGAKKKGECDGGGQLSVDKQDEVQQVGVGGERILQKNPAMQGETKLHNRPKTATNNQDNEFLRLKIAEECMRFQTTTTSNVLNSLLPSALM